MSGVSGLSTRPTYTTDQIWHIYKRINLPSRYRYEPGDSSRTLARSENGLAYLAALQRHCLANVPFENLELHYSPTKAISLDPQILFDKIVTQSRGRGGYCMENNAFFKTLLHTLGFQLYSVGARVNSAADPSGEGQPRQSYGGFGHMLNIVNIEGEKYLVDVGFGSGGTTHPLPLKDRQVSVNIAPNQEVRLRWDAIPENENPDAKLWIFERRDGQEKPWIPTYCFSDAVEFLPGDFEIMNHATSTRRTSFFTYKIICAKFVLSEDGEELVGTVVLFGSNLHRRKRGTKEVIKEQIESEKERVDLLEEHLGVSLSDSQRAGIRGMVTALR